MNHKKNLKMLNSLYQPLYEKATFIYNQLLEEKLDATLNWHNGHSNKIGNKYYYEYYPIPIISLEDIDIGFHFTGTFIDINCSKIIAMNIDYQYLQSISFFEIYQSNEYLKTICSSAESDIKGIIKNVASDYIHIACELDENEQFKKIRQIINLFFSY